MRSILGVIGAFIISVGVSQSEPVAIPYPVINAPVVHAGQFHILNAAGTYVILDGERGMSICTIGHGVSPTDVSDPSNIAIENASFAISAITGGKTVELDQVYDAEAKLVIVAQGPDYVAARTYFRMCSSDGYPYGTGTIDIWVYPGRIHIAPSIYIEYEDAGVSITRAGMYSRVSGKNAKIRIGDTVVNPRDLVYFESFGSDTDGFNVMIETPDRPAVKIGWLRNRYPQWLYLNEIDKNPETDELYEMWPPWITQRGSPIGWKRTERSGFLTNYSEAGPEKVSFLWINNETFEVPTGGTSQFNGIVAIFLDKSPEVVNECWYNHEHPVKPEVRSGAFKYYNEIEGIYEIDSKEKDVEVTFNGMNETYNRKISLRIWNLEGKNACELKVNGRVVPFALLNDGDLVPDPLVDIVKEATGPARFATVALTAKKGLQTRITMNRKPGLQFTYQMYSALETYEAWSGVCMDNPLFKLHISKVSLYNVTLPDKNDYAFIKLPLYWIKSFVNPSAQMNHIRDVLIEENGPQTITFTLNCVDLLGRGLSSYTVSVPYIPDRLTFHVEAEFTPLDSGTSWSSLEYCDLYPFDNVYRRTFHYDDIIFLNDEGVFERVGTGAWSGRFRTIHEPERLGYYAEATSRKGPGSRVPKSSDGSVWILGDNPQRGNIIYYRNDWTISSGTVSVFSLCNAWVDIHNRLSGRENLSSREVVHFTVDVFGGSVPSLDRLNALYEKAAGGKMVKQLSRIQYSNEGRIIGFLVK